VVSKLQLIGLYSDHPGCGKTAVARILQEERGFEVVSFAGTLKRMTRILLLDLGMSEQEIKLALTKNKEMPEPLLAGRTPRELMQTLGTQWGRGCMDEELWNRCWFGRVADELLMGSSVVTDDVRFPNEAKLLRDHGGLLIKVERPDGGSDRFAGHASEGALAATPMDGVLLNDGSLEDLRENALRLVAHLGRLKHAAS
jgi:hypothetical protein